jgi:predicted dehydrogenase
MKKLALIGCGGIGRYHLQHFLQFKDIQLAGFCALIPERAASFAAAAAGPHSQSTAEVRSHQADMVFSGFRRAHGEIGWSHIRTQDPLLC